LAHSPKIPLSYDYCNRLSSGVNTLTIVGGHTLDVVEAVLAPISEVDARTEIRWPKVKLIETGEESVREAADWVGVLGKTRSGVVFTANIEAGVQPEKVHFSFEVGGSEGWMSLTSTHPYGVQAGDLTLTSNVALAPPEEAVASGGFMGAAINVGELYAHLFRDMHAGGHTTLGFEHAVHNAHLIEAVRRAAERGERQHVTD
jgi:predicted dehydrogenase